MAADNALSHVTKAAQIYGLIAALPTLSLVLLLVFAGGFGAGAAALFAGLCVFILLLTFPSLLVFRSTHMVRWERLVVAEIATAISIGALLLVAGAPAPTPLLLCAWALLTLAPFIGLRRVLSKIESIDTTRIPLAFGRLATFGAAIPSAVNGGILIYWSRCLICGDMIDYLALILFVLVLFLALPALVVFRHVNAHWWQCAAIVTLVVALSPLALILVAARSSLS